MTVEIADFHDLDSQIILLVAIAEQAEKLADGLGELRTLLERLKDTR